MDQTLFLPESSNVEGTVLPQECHVVISEEDRVSTNLGKGYDVCLHMGQRGRLFNPDTSSKERHPVGSDHRPEYEEKFYN